MDTNLVHTDGMGDYKQQDYRLLVWDEFVFVVSDDDDDDERSKDDDGGRE